MSKRGIWIGGVLLLLLLVGCGEPGLFEVLFLVHSDDGMLLGMSWGAPEGENLFVLKETNGVFQETDLRSGRYWAPQ